MPDIQTPARHRPGVARKHAGMAFSHVIALVLVALYLMPMLYIVMVALTPTGESTTSVPSRLEFGNFGRALASSDFGLFFVNSALITIVSALSQIVLSCMAGYALAKTPLPESKTLLMFLVSLLVLPGEVVMIPLFVMVTRTPLLNGNDLFGQGGQGMLDSYFALMLPHLVSALAIFLMRQFYADLPDEIGQAARVDGASEFRIFARIYTPLTLPAVAVVTVLAFQSAWNDFLWPLIIVRSSQMRTLQLGLTIFYQENSTQWNLLMAAILMMSIPVAIIFLVGQRWFTSGITAGSVK
ncbi:carbohydrate ABC transporter permease [Aestuariimicrobium soli]|uniref:carbohydrate ABC transporter permease n=1 Tax=Aestuariimicrobium soli TaxID=2035834 RepID=UPI003EBD95C4